MKHLIVLLCLGLMALNACGGGGSGSNKQSPPEDNSSESGQLITDEILCKFRYGVTTQADLIAVLGQPMSTSGKSDDDVILTYKYLKTTGTGAGRSIYTMFTMFFFGPNLYDLDNLDNNSIVLYNVDRTGNIPELGAVPSCLDPIDPTN